LGYRKADALGSTRDDHNLVFEALRGENSLFIGGSANWHRHLHTDLYCDLFSLFRNLLTGLSGTRLLVSVELLVVEIQRRGVMAVEVLAYCFHHWRWATQVRIGLAFSEVLSRIHVISDKATALVSFFLGKYREEVKVSNALLVRGNFFQAHQVFAGVGAIDKTHWDIEKLIVSQRFHNRHHWCQAGTASEQEHRLQWLTQEEGTHGTFKFQLVADLSHVLEPVGH